MRVLTAAVILLTSSALAPSFAEDGAKSAVPTQSQMTPVQPDRSPQQSEQSRGQDQKSAEDVRIGRDWKTEGAPSPNSNQTTTGASPATVPATAEDVRIGRDWKAEGASSPNSNQTTTGASPATVPAAAEPDAKATKE